MALVTDTEVKAIIDTERDTTSFIETADLIVSESLSSSGLSAARLKQIELYLAAHFTAITEEKGNLSEHGKGDSKEKYAMTFDRGFAITRYGQQAMDLDTSGILRSMANKGQKAQFRVV